MANRVERFEITIDPETTLQSDALTFGPGTVTGFTIEIPAGHHRLTGIAILYGTSQIVPFAGNAWFTGDHITRHWELEDPHPGGAGWFANSFNNDHHYTHKFHCEVELDPLDLTAGDLPPVILLPFSGDATATTAPGLPAPGSGG